MSASIHQVPKELRPVVREAIGRGCWTLEERRKGTGHALKLVHTSGRIVPLATSPSERLATRKLGSQLRRVERSHA